MRLRLVAASIVLLCAVACSRSPVDTQQVDAALDAGALDAAADAISGTSDAGGWGDVISTEPDADDLLPAVVDIATPERSEALDALYCGLDNGQLVQAALRGAACIELSVAGVLDEASRGYVYGAIHRDGYAPATLGYCDALRCLSNARTCDDAVACDALRRGTACEAYTSRCDGDVLESCEWNGEAYQWLRVQDCGRMAGTCVETTCDDVDCIERATCVGPTQTEACGYYGRCDGQTLRRCLEPDPATGLPTEVAIDCGELVDDGVCIEVPVGGEAPGPACLSDEVECVAAFAEGFECTGRTTMSICLYGQVVDIDCADYGYRGCDDLGFFGVRCAP